MAISAFIRATGRRRAVTAGLRSPLISAGQCTPSTVTTKTPSRRIATATAAVTATPDVPGIEQVKPTALRWEAVRNAKPFSEFLTDTFERKHNYLRISITERCNLRCTYCMPAEGVPLSPEGNLLTTPEILHLAKLFVSQGVTKIRLTGGEPTIRKDIVELITELGKLRSQGLTELAITSNGIVLARKLPKLVEAGLTGVNLSLDTMDPWKFQLMTRRKGMEAVLKSIDTALQVGVKSLKINCVVMKGVNDMEIPDFVALTKDKPIEVRFIEYMPFDGNKWNQNKMVPFADMLNQIKAIYPTIGPALDAHNNDTSKTYQIPGHLGRVGFITSMTHNFCGSCNRLRITSDGNLKVCLFGEEEVSLRDLMRTSDRRKEIVQGKVVETGDASGEAREMQQELLSVIGLAVKGKREKHAGMGELENMKNRPMILIGG
ncbi:hypothetical protein DFH27DRAFT_49137 [Peziza echinospora]|nr:hypothetical protein DFH27DRAFT_49137 [Peziza echinospora]